MKVMIVGTVTLLGHLCSVEDTFMALGLRVKTLGRSCAGKSSFLCSFFLFFDMHASFTLHFLMVLLFNFITYRKKARALLRIYFYRLLHNLLGSCTW
jgi:hypothetical protein